MSPWKTALHMYVGFCKGLLSPAMCLKRVCKRKCDDNITKALSLFLSTNARLFLSLSCIPLFNDKGLREEGERHYVS